MIEMSHIESPSLHVRRFGGRAVPKSFCARSPESTKFWPSIGEGKQSVYLGRLWLVLFARLFRLDSGMLNKTLSGFEDVFKLFLEGLSMFEFDCRCYAFVLNVVFHCNFSLKLNNQICIYWYHANGMGSN